MSFDPVYPDEVERIINHLLQKTSPLDAVPVSVLKQCTSEMAVVISHLANLSFSTGRFPRIMTIGWITPLQKKSGS
jgi:hypothetical protein